MTPERAAHELDRLASEMERSAEAISLLSIHTGIRIRAQELRVLASVLRAGPEVNTGYPETDPSSHRS